MRTVFFYERAIKSDSFVFMLTVECLPQDACAVDYDPIDKRIYWLDCHRQQIMSARPNGSEVMYVVHVTVVSAARLALAAFQA